MKVNINNEDDVVYLTFNDNEITGTISLEQEVNVDIDCNNKAVGVEIIHHSKLKEWASDLLQEDGFLSLLEDDIAIFNHQGYLIAWFNLTHVNTEQHTPCNWYLEGGVIKHDTVENFIQDEINGHIKQENMLNG